jgi:glycolate oxidase
MANVLRTSSGFVDQLRAAVGSSNVQGEHQMSPDVSHDESLRPPETLPRAVVRPGDRQDVAAVVQLAHSWRVPVVPRGAGTGLSGGCWPRDDGIVLSTERMSRIVDIDELGHTAVVEPGVTLQQINEAAQPLGLVYPVFPGTDSGSIGGTIATNAGGMRAVRYGVTRHNVLGLEVVIGTGEVVRAGGAFVKSASGYDLTQLVIGSEGTLGVVTEATLKLTPLMAHSVTVLAPFHEVSAVATVVPQVLSRGMQPSVLEYIDRGTMRALLTRGDFELGVPPDVVKSSDAHLVVVLEGYDSAALERAVEELGNLLDEAGAIDVYVLDGRHGLDLLQLRESAFWMVKANGADDLIDMAVPRARIPAYLTSVRSIAERLGSRVFGCGHAGDGNIHFSVYEPDDRRRRDLLMAIYRAGLDLGGTLSGEHGIGRSKRMYYEAFTDPAKLALERRIRAAFDPCGIMNPGAVFTWSPDGSQ